MKHPRKRDAHLITEIEVSRKQKLIKNPAQINSSKILLIDLNGLWIACLLAVLSETSSEH